MRLTTSSALSRSPSSSAAISSEIRSSPGSSWRAASSSRVYSTNSVAARSIAGRSLASFSGSNWDWIRFAQTPSRPASEIGAPINSAIIRAG